MKTLFTVESSQLGDDTLPVFEWSASGQYLAAAGRRRKVCIFDKAGKLLEELSLPLADGLASDAGDKAGKGSCAALAWDPTSDQLAILPAGGLFPIVWNATLRETLNLDTGFKLQECTAMAWSVTGSILAVGTAKGNLLLYNSRERKKTQVMGKHTKRITAGAWNKAGVLALTSEDKNITLTDGATGWSPASCTVCLFFMAIDGFLALLCVKCCVKCCRRCPRLVAQPSRC